MQIHVDYAEVRGLYFDNRYLDAYELTADLWDDPGTIDALDVPQLTLAARLADRLGGGKVSRWLFRVAAEREPDSPYVRFYSRYATKKIRDLYDDLREFDSNSELNSGDPEVDADWFCWQAMVWANMRNFEKAHNLIERAEGLIGEYPYSMLSRSQILLREDKWDCACEVIERARALKPKMAGIVGAWADILTKLNRIDEVIAGLESSVLEKQSFDIARMLVWYKVGKAERAEAGDDRDWASEAHELAETLPELAPLADRFTRISISMARFDAALCLRNRELITRHAREAAGPFFDKVVKTIEANPDGECKILPHKPIQQKHDTCFPASVTTVLSAFDIDINQDDLAKELTYGGTPAWRVREWAKRNDLALRNFIITPEIAGKLIDAELPFVLCYQEETYAHAVAVVGYDDFTGALIIHDPNSFRWSRYVRARINKNEFPLGPTGTIVCPKSRLDDAKSILAEVSEICALEQDFWQQSFSGGFLGCRPIIDEMKKLAPDHPITRRLEAVLAAQCGNPNDALKIQQQFLEDHPDCLPMKSDMLMTLSRLRNTSLSREILESIVDQKIVPGLSADNKWSYPPTTYVVRYVDIIRLSEDKIPKARRLIRKTLKRDPMFAENYHLLADMLDQEQRHDDCILPYRIAADLDPVNDHYAEALAYACRRAGREGDGISYLKERVERIGDLVDGANAWQVLVRTLEAYGHPDEAIDTLDRALKKHPENERLLLFAVQFYVEWSFRKRADAALAELKAHGSRGAYVAGAVHYYRHAGDWRTALKFCREWVELAPTDVAAMDALLGLSEFENGRKSAIEQAESWAAEHPDDEMFEELLYPRLDSYFLRKRKEKLIRRRIDRSAEDAWAWRELGHLILDKIEVTVASERDAFRDEFQHILAEAKRTAPHDPSTLLLEGRWLEVQGDEREAVDGYLRTLEHWPENTLCYVRIWQCAESWPEEDCRQLRDDCEARLLATRGQLTAAHTLAQLIAKRFGLAEALEAIGRWRTVVARDPVLAYAEAELLLTHGQGKDEARKAIRIIEQAVEDFPHYLTLRYTLAQAYLNAFENDKSMTILEGILEDNPSDAFARIHMGRRQASGGDVAGAIQILEEGVAMNPLDDQLRITLTQIHWDAQNYRKAVEVFEEGIKFTPENISLRETFISRLVDIGRNEQAIQVARDGVDVFPDGAYMWHLLGKTLAACPSISSRSEIESAYHKALEHNAALLEAVENLAFFCLDQDRFDDARKLFKESIPSLSGPDRVRAQCRLAWLLQAEGKPDKAIQSLRKTLKKHPRETMAWQLLFTWLEEQEDWGQLKKAISEVPDQLLDDPEFHGRILLMRQSVGEDPKELDSDWDKLCSNHPDNHYVHMVRFDILWERDDYDGAVAVLDEIDEHCPMSPYVHARRATIHSQNNDKERTLAAAQRVWELPGEDEIWPETTAWEAVERRNWTQDAVDRIVMQLEQGEAIRPAAFRRMMNNLVTMYGAPIGLDNLTFFGWFKQRRIIKTINRIIQILDAVQWESASERAQCLEALVSLKKERSVVAYMEANKEECHAKTPLWQAVGRAFNSLDRHEECCNWFAGWEERPGIRQWAIANYAVCLHKLERLDELQAASRHALEILEHDHTARFHATCLASASLRLGKIDEFQAAMDRFEPHREGRYKEAWLPPAFIKLPRVLDVFRRLESASNKDEVAQRARIILDCCAEIPNSRWIKILLRQQIGEKLGGFSGFMLRMRTWF